MKVFSLFTWEYEGGWEMGGLMPPPGKVPSNKGHFRFSSPVLRIESLLRNICRNTFLLSLYWYFLPVNYTSLDFFLIMVRCIFSLESSCLSPLILAGPCIRDSPALLFACLLLPLVQVSVRVPASVRPVLPPVHPRCWFCFGAFITTWQHTVWLFVYCLAPELWI